MSLVLEANKDGGLLRSQIRVVARHIFDVTYDYALDEVFDDEKFEKDFNIMLHKKYVEFKKRYILPFMIQIHIIGVIDEVWLQYATRADGYMKSLNIFSLAQFIITKWVDKYDKLLLQSSLSKEIEERQFLDKSDAYNILVVMPLIDIGQIASETLTDSMNIEPHSINNLSDVEDTEPV